MGFSSRRFRSIFSIALCSLIIFGCATPAPRSVLTEDPYRRTKASMTSLIQEEMRRHHVQGLSIAVIDGQKVVWAEGFGYANVRERIPAKPETVYPAGSIAKLFTITAALQLAEQNRIDLDRPFQSYVPEFAIKTRFPGSGLITVRSLMTHHSGLPSDYLRQILSLNPVPLAALAKGLEDEWAAYPPNFVFSYSNLAIQLLGLLLERVSQKEFASYMKETLFQPMGMTHTSFVSEPPGSPFLSKGYRRDQESKDILLHPLPSPDSPIYTSVLDLSRFIRMIFADGKADKQPILGPETLSETFRRQNGDIALDLDFQIGLGWFLNEFNLKDVGPVASHGGTLSLFHSQMIILPEQKLGVVVLANSSGAIQVVDRIAEKALRFALEEKTGIAQTGREEKTARKSVIPWTPELLKEVAGQYATGLRVFNVYPGGGKLYTRLMGREVELCLHPDGRFSVRYRLLGLIPIKLGPLERMTFSLDSIRGRKVLILNDHEKRYLLGEKIEPSPISDAWLKRIGEYRLADEGNYHPVFEKAQLKYEDNFLTLDVRIPLLGDYGVDRLQFAIRPVSDSEAVLLGLGRNMGETIRVVNDHGVERLHYSGLRFEKKVVTSSARTE